MPEFLYIWGLIFLAETLLSAYLALRFLESAREANKRAQNYVKIVEEQTKDKCNRIAALTPNELGDFLSNVFSRMLVIESAVAISEKDNEGNERLYARAQAATIKYLGKETVHAIDYYYGTNYVIRWCDHAFKMLMMTGSLSDILNDRASVDSVKKRM